MEKHQKEILNMEEAADFFGVSIKTFIKLLKEESVPGRKIGREWRFSKAALVEWLSLGNSQEYSQSDSDSKQYFDRIAPCWEEISRGYYDESIVNKLIQMHILDKGTTVADYGCGDGYIARGISSYVKQVFAVDISSAMLDELERKAEKQEIKNIVVLECEKNDIPLRKSSADLVCASMILHHLEKPQEILFEMHRVLKKNGRIFIADFYEHSDKKMMHELHDVWLGFNPDVMAMWLENAGFHCVGIEKAKAHQSNQKDIFIVTGTKKG